MNITEITDLERQIVLSKFGRLDIEEEENPRNTFKVLES